MEKIVKVTVNIENARKALALAGFWKIAESGTDDAVFERVLEMLHSYCARTEIIEPPISPDAVGLLTAMAILAEPIDPRAEDGSAGFTSMFSEFDDDVCNDGVAF
jgi:hypothetical protein